MGALERGVPVVVATRCRRGEVTPIYGGIGGFATLHAAGAVSSHGLGAGKARLALQVAARQRAGRARGRATSTRWRGRGERRDRTRRRATCCGTCPSRSRCSPPTRSGPTWRPWRLVDRCAGHRRGRGRAARSAQRWSHRTGWPPRASPLRRGARCRRAPAGPGCHRACARAAASVTIEVQGSLRRRRRSASAMLAFSRLERRDGQPGPVGPLGRAGRPGTASVPVERRRRARSSEVLSASACWMRRAGRPRRRCARPAQLLRCGQRRGGRRHRRRGGDRGGGPARRGGRGLGAPPGSGPPRAGAAPRRRTVLARRPTRGVVRVELRDGGRTGRAATVGLMAVAHVGMYARPASV